MSHFIIATKELHMRMLSQSVIALSFAVSTFTVYAGDALNPSQAQLKALCSDCSIVTNVRTKKIKGEASGVGAVGGAVAGGLVGHKVGDSTAATIGGAVVGGLVGNSVEKRIKKKKVWVVSTVARDGSRHSRSLSEDPNLRSGDIVVPSENGKTLRRH